MLNGKIFMRKNSEQWILLGFESIIYVECCKIHQWSTGNPISEQQHLTGTYSVAELCLTLCNPMNYNTPVFPSFTISQSFLKLMTTESVIPSNHLIPCHPLSSCPQSFPTSGSFPMSQFFPSGGQSIGALASALVLKMNIQDWFPLGLTGWISLQSKGLSRIFSNTTVKSINSSALSLLYGPPLTSIHDHWKNHSFDDTDHWQSNVSAF